MLNAPYLSAPYLSAPYLSAPYLSAPYLSAHYINAPYITDQLALCRPPQTLSKSLALSNICVFACSVEHFCVAFCLLFPDTCAALRI